MDEDGGQYDEKGFYRTAEELDQIRDQEYDEEDDDDEESKDTDAQLEREANFDTHVRPAIKYVQEQLTTNPETEFIIKIEGVPETIESSEELKTKVLQKKAKCQLKLLEPIIDIYE